MTPESVQQRSAAAWALASRQHGVVTHAQLIRLGFSAEMVRHRLTTGRLLRLHRGVYAVGHPDVTRHGRFMAAVLSCGPGALLSHESAATLWEIRRHRPGPIEVSVAADRCPRRPGIRIHRRAQLSDIARRHGIPVTRPATTLVDVATRLQRDALEAAINEADRLGLIGPDRLRTALDGMPRRPGVGVLKQTLDLRTFTRTRSWLERRFLPIARKAGLPPPLTCVIVNGYEVDFYWPGLGLVVETDGLRTHRTPAEQARDRLRDQAHLTAGMWPLRFTHDQIEHDPAHVLATLTAVVRHITNATAPRIPAA
jgi:hypothetical protein